ncbi:decarboxylase [Candidatus Woesearchaeota archaeon]|nr:decarboxylase [Candidatus Woesearchaeota archaeon]
MAKFILKKSTILEQCHTLAKSSDIISYSSKTNPKITPILEKETDCLFSLHLLNELKHVQDKSRIIFLAQGWNQQQIDFLLKEWIRFFVVDNLLDLQILLDGLKEHDVKINLLLRARLRENTIKTERYFAFGINSYELNQKIKEIKANPQISQLGIHFHRKSQNLSEWDLLNEFKDLLEEENLKHIDLVNIGGGLPAEYANTNGKVLHSILQKISVFKTYLNEHNIKLMIEPGRFIAAPAGKLVANILRIYDHNIIIDASVYNSNMDALLVPVKLKVEKELLSHQGQAYAIKGITPCSMDLFRYRVYLDCPKEGDQLVFLNAGAYNFCTNFCDLEEIPTEVVE